MSVRTKTILIISVIFVFLSIFLMVNVFNFTTSNAKQTQEAAIKQSELKDKESVKQEEKLELTQESIDLEIGAEFDFSQYIKTAEDKYGYSVKDKIKINGAVPTDKEGKYQVEYRLDIGDGKNMNKLLIINVRKFSD